MQRHPVAPTSTSLSNLQAIRSQSFGQAPPPLNRTMTAPLLDASSSTHSLISSAPSAAAGSIFNKPATVSLYQTCQIITDRLRQVVGFEELYLQDVGIVQSPLSPAKDPVTDLWHCFRLGASLCHLYNATLPDIELSVRPDASTTNMNACKAEVYHFLLACKKHLGVADEDLFTISELYSGNTNGFVKVTKTVSIVLDVLQERHLLVSRVPANGADSSAPAAPKDNRARVIEELLDTERKYVQYLEILQNYMRELQLGEVISADTSHLIFLNLNALVDFQRRFLIGIETNCALPADLQRIGLVFSNSEDAFKIYEPFCANYTYAAEVAIEETPKLKKLEHLVEPTYELPSLLIKPIQRICKYPLLLRELLKFTDKNDPYYAELEAGESAIKRVTDRVNETRRRQENEIIVLDLERRVEDWKGHSVASFGDLLLEDTFQVTKGDVEREYRVYLFERILLCCKENKDLRKNSKSMSISKKPKKRMSLQLKGRIFINNVTAAIPSSKSSIHTLQVFWKGDQDQEYFSLRCRNEENLKQWHACLTKLMEEAQVAMAEYNSTQVSNNFRARGLSNTHLTSLQQMNINDKGRGGYESDEESHQTEDTTEDFDSTNGVAMSREQSMNGSLRSRSATNESIHIPGYPRYTGLASQRNISNGMPRHLMSDATGSQFSPALDSESAYSSSRGSPSSGAYPFPRTSYHEPDQVLGNSRNTAPAMSRGNSREGYGQRQMYGLANARGSNASLTSRPGMNARTRSASSPNINGYPQRPGITIPEMPPPPVPSGVHSGQASSGASQSNGIKSPSTPAGGIKVKVNFGEDIFVIMLPPRAAYLDLMDRIEKKIRLCGPSVKDVTNFRIRYKDEDGDLITINSDEDVQMAIESVPLDTSSVLTLYTTVIGR